MHRSWYTIPFSVSWSWCQLPAAVSCTSLSTPASLHHDTPFPAASPFPAFSARTHIINVLNIFAIHMPKWICSYEVNNIPTAGKLPYIFLANHSSDKNELLNILHQIFSVRYLNAARYEKKKLMNAQISIFFSPFEIQLPKISTSHTIGRLKWPVSFETTLRAETQSSSITIRGVVGNSTCSAISCLFSSRILCCSLVWSTMFFPPTSSLLSMAWEQWTGYHISQMHLSRVFVSNTENKQIVELSIYFIEAASLQPE